MVGSWERAYGAPAAAAAALTADGGCRRVGGDGGDVDGGSEAAEDGNERLARDLWLYGGTTLVACGTVGYVLLLSVAACSRRARALRCVAFVVALSLCGVARLYMGLLSTLVRHQSCHRVAFAAVASDVGCRLGAAVHFLAAQAYAWMQACIAADRLRCGGGETEEALAPTAVAGGCFGGCHSCCCCCSGGRRRPLRCLPPPAAAIAGAIILQLACLDAVPFAAFGQDADGLCAPRDAALATSWRYAHFVLYFALPATVIVGCHVAVRWRSSRRGPNAGNDGNVGGRGSGDKKATGRERALEVATLALNLTFLLTAAPDAFADLFAPDDGGADGGGSTELIRSACGLLSYSGCAAAFALCSAVAFRYRKALETSARESPKSGDAERCDCDHCGGGGAEALLAEQQRQSSRHIIANGCWCCRRVNYGGNDSGDRMRPVTDSNAPQVTVTASVESPSESAC